jgi:hypothetical protein
MRYLASLLLVAGGLVCLGLGVSTVDAADMGRAKGPDQWRYAWHQGQWWYWLPQGRWMYWRDGRWNSYDSEPVAACPTGGVAGVGTSYGVSTQSDIRPFYGHSLSNYGQPGVDQGWPQTDIRPFYGQSFSDLDRRRPVEREEIGPFYGHALPSEVLGR